MKLNIFKLKEMEESGLLELMQQTLDTFPILKEIYDEAFLESLVKRRFYFDNYLLWLLASKQFFTHLTWEKISKCLILLKGSDAVSHFKDKLRSRTDRVFRSYQTELEFAAYYKERGYDVELEPKIPNTDKNPEFKIESQTTRVFFEAKNIFVEEIMNINDLETQIQGALGTIELPFVFNIHHRPGLAIKHISALKKFVIGKLKKIGDEESFPLTFLFPSEAGVLAKVVVLGRPNKLPHGYLGGISGGVLTFPGSESLRGKISKKISQLPKGEVNVIIIEPGHILIDEVDVDYALFGTERLRIYKDGTTEAIRTRNGILAPTKNTRLSAVLFS